MAFESVYSQIFDVVIFGAGYAGFAAAGEAQQQGKTVLLVDRRPAVLAESAWAFSMAVGQSAAPPWRAWLDALAQRSAGNADYIDGAIAEVLANQFLLDRRIRTLYYATPVAAHVDDHALAAVAVAVKEGVRVVRGRQFIDASETGQLVALVAPGYMPAAPVRRSFQLFYRYLQAPDRAAVELGKLDIPGATARLVPSYWPNERVLSVDLPGTPGAFPRHRQAWVAALTAAKQSGLVDGALMTHGSVITYDTYAPTSSPPHVPTNLGMAVAAISGSATTLAQRFDLGLAAAKSLDGLSKSGDRMLPLDFPDAAIKPRQVNTDVVVAGAGTGGAFAAIAAARQGAAVMTIEPLPFVGGIGAGGGIHWYYFGFRGGLQEEADQRVRELTPLFGASQQIRGFHPDAKKLVIEQMMIDAGAELLTGSTLYGVVRDGAKVGRAHVATPQGPLAITAESWIDATGDGDLAAHAGATHFLGRSSDCQLHAYSQSSGRAGVQKNEPNMWVVNYDAGFVDPTDTQDLTRARMVGVSHYVQEQYDAIERPTYIAPALGLRQGRHIETDYVLTLYDLVSRATFPDAVGRTGAHYDNHAIDYEFESDEGMFWVWVCRQWRSPLACQFPYRMLLPVGLSNLWIACRAAGVSADAHHSMRMQRDIQRLGEIAGLAAALACSEKTDARGVPYPKLRALLEATGALAPDTAPDDSFGPSQGPKLNAGDALPGDFAQWVADLKSTTNASLYHLVKHRKDAQPVVLPLIQDADAGTSWRAAAVAAMWDEPAAEPRLLAAIRQREEGQWPDEPKEGRPEHNNRLVPWWIVSIALLRRCGTAAMLPVLAQTAADPQLLHNARTATALTLTSLAQRVKLTAEQKDLVATILARLLATPAPNAVGGMQRKASLASSPPAAPTGNQRQPVVEDFTWQLHLAVAQAQNAAHLPVHDDAAKFLNDPRATVRKAFTRELQNF
ncbi:MAG: FAD-dependent oxidoreductase [Phycisphaeraceae bacterium]